MPALCAHGCVRESALSGYCDLTASVLLMTQKISSQGGFWKLSYTDDNYRVLYTNLGNVFILAR